MILVAKVRIFPEISAFYPQKVKKNNISTFL